MRLAELGLISEDAAFELIDGETALPPSVLRHALLSCWGEGGVREPGIQTFF